MARRTQILDALVDHLVTNTDAVANNVHKRYLYLNEVNDWPTITFIPQGEVRASRGAGARQGIIDLFLRGYIYDDDDPLGEAETFGMQIDDAVETFRDSNRALEVEEARVLEFRTDEGLFHPYGMADLTVQILYEVEDAV